MNAKNLVEVIFSDLETATNKEELLPYANLIKHIAELYPDSDVKPDATAEGLHKAMYAHAKNNQKNRCFCFSPEQSLIFGKEYLGIKEESKSLHLNAKNQTLNLEDFF